MTQQSNKRLITVEEYHKMAEAGILSHRDKLELIKGEILHMSPIGSRHQAIVDKMTRLFNRLVMDDAIVRVQGPIQIENWSEPEPDLILLKPQDDFYANHHPTAKEALLLIEVADRSLNFDKELKLPIYAEARIEEYWIINLQDDQIEIHRSPEESIYKNIIIAKNNDFVSCLHFPSISINVNDILG